MHERLCVHYLNRRHSKRIPSRGGRAITSAFMLAFLFVLALTAPNSRAASNSNADPIAAAPEPATLALIQRLGIHFVPGSSSSLVIEREGKTYLVNLANRTIHEDVASPSAPNAVVATNLVPAHASPAKSTGAEIFAANCARCHGPDGSGIGTEKTPNLTEPRVQARLSEPAVLKVVRDGKPGTSMPAWNGKLSDEQISSVSSFVKTLGISSHTQASEHPQMPAQASKVYVPADDYLFSMPTGRKLDRHGFYFNFTHRFAFSPAFSGPGGGNTLAGLDDFAIASFGLRYGITDKLSVSVYRSPSIINRPIELGVAYHFLDEQNGHPICATARVSLDGQNNFSKNFTTNFELILSRTIARRAQFYVAPTVSLQARELIAKHGELASTPPNLPGFNTLVLAVGGAVDVRPTVALVAEVFPTLVNGPELGIHRPTFAFGIQKRVYRHAFTFGFTTSPGTIVSQRAGTRATFLGQPSADTPSGLFVGFDLMRQIY